MPSIYVGNLPYTTTESELNTMFSQYGTVDRVTITMDRMTGRPRGFGFVEMSDPAAAQAAIDALNGTELGGRALTVNLARPKSDRPAGGGGRGGYGGGGGGGGYGGGGGGGRERRGGYGGGGGGRGERRGGGGGGYDRY